MDPITLRLQEDLCEQLEEESKELGYSSRSEYIRHLLQHRVQIRERLSNLPANTPNNHREQQEKITELNNQINNLEQRVKAVEDTLPESTLQPKNSCEEAISSDFTPELETLLDNWLIREGPNSDQAKEVLLRAAKILSEKEPLSTESTKDQLYEQIIVEYDTPETMWQATVQRYYDQIPGFEKVERGQYNFDCQKAHSHLQEYRSVDDFQ
ncbi:ribbon-helix-helix domain-containing protein [Natrialba sp. SSL1]|uniref:ribbon-helix-helix domain-containing protein n=1 Tax=Natrialba sp. SSL1 TaxID=1869245 RepID=UPI0008F82270|nr:ribbon-helix-helix domain-containing protein [Natrialba sp. SSL1]OIB58767.1 hypothetical protein BBD46_06850 [Natrialba sp. SSL1]